MSAVPARLLILHDSPQYGGHEVIFLKLFPALLESPDIGEITFCYPRQNEKLDDQLRQLRSSRLRLRPWDNVKRRAEPYLAGLRRGYVRQVRAIAGAVRPDVTLLLQGRIENLAVPLLALPASATVASYIPMAHSLSEMERNGAIGDRVRRRLYARPDRYIVPSASVAKQLRGAGARGEMAVVENVVDPPRKLEKSEARRRCRLSPGKRIALFLGRMDVAQKGLDTLATAIRRNAARLTDWRFVFVGGGPGMALIQALKAEIGGTVDFELVNWTDRPHEFLAAADVLLMPSRWEGVPLVMLEAMSYALPILSSRIDVFADYLPPENRIDFGSGDLAAAMDSVAAADVQQRYAAHCAERLGGVSLEVSRARFVAAVLGR